MTEYQRAGRQWTAAIATVVAAACSGGDGEPTENTGSIQLTVNPTALSVEQGSSGSVTVSLTRAGGFAGVVSLAVTGLPTGLTATVSPAQLSGSETSATVSVAAAAAVAPNAYTATITASAQGVSQASTSYQVTVTAPSAAGTDVVYEFCDASQVPVFFAYQDGTAGWRTVTGSTTQGATKFAFKLAQTRGGVLAVYRTGSAAVASGLTIGGRVNAQRTRWSLRTRDRALARVGATARTSRELDRSSLADVYETGILYASTAELVQDGLVSCAQSQPTKSVLATVNGVSTDQYGILSLGGASELFIGGTSTNPVTFTDVPNGPVDFIGTRMTDAGTPPDKAVILRNLDIPDGGSLPAVIDFNAASVVPATATATINGGAGDDLEIFTELVTATSRSLMWFDLAPSAAANRPWAGIPASAMVNGDFHTLVVFATPSGTLDYRVALKYVGAVEAQTLSLGSKLGPVTSTQVIAGVYPRFRFQGGLTTEYDKGASIDIVSTVDPGNAFSIIATSTYLAGAGNALAYDFTMPDVSGLAGFPAAARLTAGLNEVSASGFGFTGPGIFDLEPNLGSEFKAAARGFTIAVP